MKEVYLASQQNAEEEDCDEPEPEAAGRACSSRPRGSAAAAGGGTAPRTPPLRWRGPQGTRNDPDNFGSAAGGFTQAFGRGAGPKLECVEFPVFSFTQARGGWAGPKLERVEFPTFGGGGGALQETPGALYQRAANGARSSLPPQSRSQLELPEPSS